MLSVIEEQHLFFQIPNNLILYNYSSCYFHHLLLRIIIINLLKKKIYIFGGRIINPAFQPPLDNEEAREEVI